MILEGYCKFITDTCSLKKSQQPDGKNNSFQYWKSIIHDPLLPAKLKFFEMVFSKIYAFLRDLQTNKPMVPFIVDTWYCWLLILDLVRDFFYFVVLIQQMTAGHNFFRNGWIVRWISGSLGIRQNVSDSASWSIRSWKRVQCQQATYCWKTQNKIFGCVLKNWKSREFFRT